MSVFISWSGDVSREVAESLRDWLRVVLQGSDPWMSVSIETGARWSHEIAGRLEETSIGILCVTSENQSAPWLLFEAGALAKSASDARVTPYLFGMSVADLRQGPLTQFQACEADESGTWQLLESLNARQSRPVESSDLRTLFDATWPGFASTLAQIRNAPAVARRSEREILEEVLVLARRIAAGTAGPPGKISIRIDASHIREEERAVRLKKLVASYPGSDTIELECWDGDGAIVSRLSERVDGKATGLHAGLTELFDGECVISMWPGA